jgi:hypothetical protein
VLRSALGPEVLDRALESTCSARVTPLKQGAAGLLTLSKPLEARQE